MKAVEVIEQYKSGRRDFRGESLRGCDFKNQELGGADFSGCDIRGANFSGANLTEVKFEKAKAGLRKRWVIILLLVALVLMVISSFFSSLVGVFVAYIFDQSSTKNQIIGWVDLIVLLSFYIITWRKNLLLGAAAVATAVATAGIAVVVGTSIAGDVAGTVVGTVVGTVALGTVALGTAVVGTAVAGTVVVLIVVVLTVVVLTVVVLTGLWVLAETSAGKVAIEVGTKIAAIGLVLTLFFSYIGWLTLKQEHRDPWLRKIVIAFVGLSGTSFFQANLTATDFTGATLKSTNFNQAKLNKTIFKQAIKLELARPGKTLLVNPQVRELLINPSTGAGQDLTKADLRGANLDGANLQRTNLRLADLSQASFRYANLREANLTEVNAVNADLSYATLTGACVENWNIDATTQLENIDCQYVYLLNNQKERRPSSGEFDPGEFTQLFEEVFDTVDLIFRDGMDWKALMNTLKEVQVQNEETPLQVQAIENKGNGVFVVKVHVPPDANKEKIHQEFTEIYQIKAQLEAKDEQLKFLREQNTDLTQIIKIQAQNQTKVEISYNKQDHSQTINAAQDFNINATQESTVNLRDINSSTQASGENHEH
jgi:uncharacterized protein YjbI with pentapeptide repeats